MISGLCGAAALAPRDRKANITQKGLLFSEMRF